MNNVVNNIQSKIGTWIIFVISPFAGVLFSLRHFRWAWSKNIVWAFVVFYGFTFVISNEGMDANRYKEKFQVMAAEDIDFDGFVSILYNEETRYVDIAQPFISFAVSRITDNSKFLFATFGLVFGFFYSRNIWFVLERCKTAIGPLQVLLLLCFAFAIGIWQINGFRFWTAAHIFFYGVLHLMHTKKRFYWYYILLCPFVHFSFILPLGVFLAFQLFKSKVTLHFYFFIVSLFITSVDLGVVRSYTETIPDLFKNRTESYTAEETIEKRQESKNNTVWYALWNRKLLYWACIGFCVLLYTKRKRIKSLYPSMFRVFSFALFFTGWANLASLMPSGGRFLSMSILFILAVVLSVPLVWTHSRLMKRYTIAVVPILLLFIVVSLRIGFDTIGVFTVFGNVFTVGFVEQDTALIEFIK